MVLARFDLHVCGYSPVGGPEVPVNFGRVPVDFGHKRVLVLPAEPAPAGTGMVPAASVASELAALAASVPAAEHLVAMQAVVASWYQVREQSAATGESKP